jgi:hypothetical protein
MNDPDRLLGYVTAAKERGVEDGFLVALLRQNGWSERSVYQAFSVYYESRLGMPLPTRGGRIEYAGDAFLYLLQFISLGFWAFAVGHLFYVLIDRRFPSSLDYNFYSSSFRQAVSYELATILIAFPVFFFVGRAIVAGLAKRPETAESGVRKWLTYIALVIAAVILLADGIWFLQAFLHGDLTTRFILKSLVLASIAGGIFGYYLSAMRGEAVMPKRDRAFAALAGVAVALALTFGFTDLGTPAHARDVSADERRVQDLEWLTSEIHSAADNGTPPRTLDSVPSSGYYRGWRSSRTDPITYRPYEYRPLAGKAYRLCAIFAAPDSSFTSGKFAHGAGRTCFNLDASRSYY